MKLRRLWALLLSCSIVLGCTAAPAAAAEVETDIGGGITLYGIGRLNHVFPANAFVRVGQQVSLDVGDTITYDCTYTPSSASVDFGVIAPDGLFYPMNCTSGSINQSLEVNQRGVYQPVIRNNESYSVTITGTVQC